ncbi:DUF1629 domain-containing protein [Bradyrhizobium sp. 197]|uniref:imm11 family protein n=1 Tax=Bradyrhizobium sp. 197 TaxID=2782663 RepID=UPI001FF8E48F|nr:DUF1629 domain-containing protein [Bradyrhizobium sp. 197]MCK1475535.1 DUF1629 domain-containing protein [Bradyrhizobium sp. 197]
MNDDNEKVGSRRRSVRKGQYYEMALDYRPARPRLTWENAAALAPGTRVLAPPPGRRGFPEYSEQPRFLFEKKRVRQPLDIREFHSFWLLSDPAKMVFQTVDHAGFAFAACDVSVSRGTYDGPRYWLCDATRVLDALDEEQSRLEIGIRDDPKYNDFGKKYYKFGSGAKLVFNKDAVGSAHVFRMAFCFRTVICDQALKDACKEAGLLGIKFNNALDI